MGTLLRSTRLRYSGLLLICLLGIGLRPWRLPWQPLWADEGYSVYFASEPLLHMVKLTAQDIHPPLYYALLHGWLQLLGTTAPVALRLFSVLMALLALPLFMRLAATLFPQQPRLRLVAILLFALNPLLLFYSQEVRMYGLALTCSPTATSTSTTRPFMLARSRPSLATSIRRTGAWWLRSRTWQGRPW